MSLKQARFDKFNLKELSKSTKQASNNKNKRKIEQDKNKNSLK